MYKALIRPLLFLWPAEQAHHIAFFFLKRAQAFKPLRWVLRGLYGYQNPGLERRVLGLRFPNPVGLAAGFDKNGVAYNAFGSLGFGFVEIGTVTPLAQSGNDLPRLFRLPQDRALVNRMGFNNGGVKAMVQQLRKHAPEVIIGGNIGKNKNTPNEEAVSDYLTCLEALHPHVDYFAVNVSSPNTPNLRALQEKEPLTALLSAVQEKNLSTGKPKPVLLKIAPDLTDGQLDDVIDIVRQTGIAGVIATNTTLDRSQLTTPSAAVESIGMGGLSGLPVQKRSTEIIQRLRAGLGPAIPIIGCGGIFTGRDALEKLQAGATLVQVYTGFVYEGPAQVKHINRYLAKHLPAKSV
jgi:dihydroorotate dehydrogenase